MQITISTQSNFPARAKLTPLEKIVSSALRQTIRAAKRDAAERIRARYISASLGTTKLKARVNGLTARLYSQGPRNALMKFRVKPRQRLSPQPKGGIFAQVLKGGGGGYIAKGFIAKGNVFERAGKARLPIQKLTSVSAPQMAGVPPISEFVLAKIEANFDKFLGAEISKIGLF